VVVVVWVLLMEAAVFGWPDFVEATGDTTSECDRGTCGALGEFTSDHPSTLFSLFAAGAAVPAAVIAWLLGRLLRSPGDEARAGIG
jgi:hypothetical protein